MGFSRSLNTGWSIVDYKILNLTHIIPLKLQHVFKILKKQDVINMEIIITIEKMCPWGTDSPLLWQTGSRQMKDMKRIRHGTIHPDNASDQISNLSDINKLRKLR